MKKSIPFSFVLDYLHPLDPLVKPMFGCHAVYLGAKIVFVLRKRKDHANDNGVWLATSYNHHTSLKKDFPSMRSIVLLNDGKGKTGWQLIPEDADDFEESAMKVCEFIMKGDPRIGKVPARKNNS